MIDDALQHRVHLGDRDAFAQLYEAYARGVYDSAMSRLSDAALSREVTKAVFVGIYQQLRAAAGPLKLEEAFSALTDAEIARVRPGDEALFQDPAFENMAAAAVQASVPATPPRHISPADAPRRSHSAPLTPRKGTPVASVPQPGPMRRLPPREAPAAPTARSAKKANFRQSAPQKPVHADILLPDEPETPVNAGQAGKVLALIPILFFMALFLWIIVGILMDFGILPKLNLGYTWFNSNIYHLFNA